MKKTSSKHYYDDVEKINDEIINKLYEISNTKKSLKQKYEFLNRTNKLTKGYLTKTINDKANFKIAEINDKYNKKVYNQKLSTDINFYEEELKKDINKKFNDFYYSSKYSYAKKNLEIDNEFTLKIEEFGEKLKLEFDNKMSKYKPGDLSEVILDEDKIANIRIKAKEKIEKTNVKFEKKKELLKEKEVKETDFKIKRLETKLNELYQKRNLIIDNEDLEMKKEVFDFNLIEPELDSNTILSVKNITMQFGGLTAVDNLSFDIKKGEIFGLIGPNGAGKTTVFNCITKFYEPTNGEIKFRRNIDSPVVNITNEKVHDVITKGIARTFQNVELVYELTVLENLMVGSHSRFNSNIFDIIFKTRRLKYEEGVVLTKALDILEKFDLTSYMNFYPASLPYGILKKVEFARSLMSEPSLIILDEPAAGLNEIETKELSELILKIRDDFDTTILLVEHDMGLVMSISDRICAINFGKEITTGTPKEVQNNQEVKVAYLGGIVNE